MKRSPTWRALSRLDLSDDELAHYAEQLDVILGSVARVSEAVQLLGQGQDIPPTSHALPLVNVTRPDVERRAWTRRTCSARRRPRRISVSACRAFWGRTDRW